MQNLEPVHDSKKSFYGKAETNADKSQLFSYGKLAAFLERPGRVVLVKDVYNLSNTTKRHVKEWLAQTGHLWKGNEPYSARHISPVSGIPYEVREIER